MVAPAIGEALITTAIGLAAAIPAVFFYNWIDKSVGDFVAELEAAAAEWVALVTEPAAPFDNTIPLVASVRPAAGGRAGRRAMALSTGKRGGGSLREINVTPLVDVMLVLLIVFMVTAPLLTTGLHIELPEVQATNTPVKDAKLVVSITKDEHILFGEDDVTADIEKALLAEPARAEGARALHPRRQGRALRRRRAGGGRRAGRRASRRSTCWSTRRR